MVLVESVIEVGISKRQMLSVRDVARRTGYARNTVTLHLKREGAAIYTARPALSGNLEAHKAIVSERMIAAHTERLPGTVLLGELRAQDYTGGITILREHLINLPALPVVRFETQPDLQTTGVTAASRSDYGVACCRTSLARMQPLIYFDQIGYPDEMNEIQLREAKATLSAVIDSARKGEPSIITRRGRREAVVLSFEDWERLSNVPVFGRLLAVAPFTAGDLSPRHDGLREVES